MAGIKIEKKIPALDSKTNVQKYLNVVKSLVGGPKSMMWNLGEIKENISTCSILRKRSDSSVILRETSYRISNSKLKKARGQIWGLDHSWSGLEAIFTLKYSLSFSLTRFQLIDFIFLLLISHWSAGSFWQLTVSNIIACWENLDCYSLWYLMLEKMQLTFNVHSSS